MANVIVLNQIHALFIIKLWTRSFTGVRKKISFWNLHPSFTKSAHFMFQIFFDFLLTVIKKCRTFLCVIKIMCINCWNHYIRKGERKVSVNKTKVIWITGVSRFHIIFEIIFAIQGFSSVWKVWFTQIPCETFLNTIFVRDLW